MRTIGNILFVGMLVMNYVGQLPAQEKSPAILLQEALYQEETEGNLDKAMELYGQVLEQAADVERVAARAAYQLGLCHLKKDNPTEAADWFRKVVNDYPKQASMVKKAQAELQKISPETKESVFEQIDTATINFIARTFAGTVGEAAKNNLQVNSHIYYVSPKGFVYSGGINYYFNWSGQTITNRIKLTGMTGNHYTFYNTAGEPLNVEFVRDNPQSNHYTVYWIPAKSFSPGEALYYGWSNNSKQTLPPTPNEGYWLSMSNHFGDPVVETFFLVVPKEMRIAESTPPSGSEKLPHFDVYWWTKQQGPNEAHTEFVTLAKEPDHAGNSTLEQPVNVNISTSPDGDRLTVQYAAMEIAKAAGIPYQWQKSQDLAGSKARRYIEPFAAENKSAADALNELLMPIGLTYGVDENGLFLTTPENLNSTGKPDKLKAEDLVAEGWQLWQQRKLAEAEAKFEEAINADPQSEGAYQGLGWAQLNQGKKQNAEVSFKKCVKLNPENSAALNGLGWIAYGNDDKQTAIKWWKKAVEAQPGATAALSGLTQAYTELGQYKEAVKYYELWLKVEPNSQEAKDGLAAVKQSING